jgi:hypothetical protein
MPVFCPFSQNAVVKNRQFRGPHLGAPRTAATDPIHFSPLTSPYGAVSFTRYILKGALVIESSKTTGVGAAG